jgi:hypothetical protein
MTLGAINDEALSYWRPLAGRTHRMCDPVPSRWLSQANPFGPTFVAHQSDQLSETLRNSRMGKVGGSIFEGGLCLRWLVGSQPEGGRAQPRSSGHAKLGAAPRTLSPKRALPLPRLFAYPLACRTRGCRKFLKPTAIGDVGQRTMEGSDFLVDSASLYHASAAP